MAMRVNPVAMLVALTVAPRTTDFPESLTTPVMSADELRACAKAGEAAKPRVMTKQKTFAIRLSMLPPILGEIFPILGDIFRRVGSELSQRHGEAVSLRDACLWLARFVSGGHN